MDDDLLDAAEAMRPDGLVLEGFGRGGFPARIIPGGEAHAGQGHPYCRRIPCIFRS